MASKANVARLRTCSKRRRILDRPERRPLGIDGSGLRPAPRRGGAIRATRGLQCRKPVQQRCGIRRLRLTPAPLRLALLRLPLRQIPLRKTPARQRNRVDSLPRTLLSLPNAGDSQRIMAESQQKDGVSQPIRIAGGCGARVSAARGSISATGNTRSRSRPPAHSLLPATGGGRSQRLSPATRSRRGGATPHRLVLPALGDAPHRSRPPARRSCGR